MAADLIEVAFALQGRSLPRDHRASLAEALRQALPWLDEEPRVGVHRLKLVADGAGEALVSPRTRLVLRIPRERQQAAEALAGATLRVDTEPLRVMHPQVRELLPYGTLYAHLVASDGTDEAAFVLRLRDALGAMDVTAQPVCGRWQPADAPLPGCSVMLSGLDAAQSLRVLEQGVGPHRLLGCGLFVPHKSAAAVGVPD